MLGRIASIARCRCGGAFRFPPIAAATLHQPLGRFTSTQNFEPVPSNTTDEGYPISITPEGTFALPAEIHRQDVMRFFSGFHLTDEDVVVQYLQTFRPQAWWIRFHSEADRKKALSIRSPIWGNLKMVFEKKSVGEWKDRTYNHLMMKSYGNAILVSRLTFDTVPADLASFFRNFHLQGNGMTMLEDPHRPNVEEQGQFKRAIVRLISKQEAQRAARALHRKQLRTNRVNVRVLQ